MLSLKLSSHRKPFTQFNRSLALLLGLVAPATLLAQALSTADLATRFFQYAESSAYKSYFPSGATTTSYPPFLYRAYSTGTVLGVASGNNATYPDGVYTMGGAFGPTPSKVGKVSDFIMTDALPIAVTPPISAGGGYTMVVTTDGKLWGIGNNSSAQIGDGTSKNKNAVVQVATDVVSVMTAESTTYFIKKDGTLWGMGKFLTSFLTTVVQNAQLTPIKIANDVIAVSHDPGGIQTLYLKADKTLWAMGSNAYSDLGSFAPVVSTLITTPLFITGDVIAFSAGDGFSTYIKSDHTLWGFGENNSGQLGDGTKTTRLNPIQIATSVASVSAGNYFTGFVKTDGTLWMMGSNSYGQIGDGTTTDRLTPYQVTTGVDTVSTGQYTTHFIKTDGSLWGMGNNSSGQVGDGTTTLRKTPVQVTTSVAVVTDGEFHTAFVKKDGTIWGMGDNGANTLGDNSFTDQKSPVKMIITGTARVTP